MSLGKVQTAQRRHKAALAQAHDAGIKLQWMVVAARKEGHSVQEIADALGVHRQRVYQIIKR